VQNTPVSSNRPPTPGLAFPTTLDPCVQPSQSCLPIQNVTISDCPGVVLADQILCSLADDLLLSRSAIPNSPIMATAVRFSIFVALGALFIHLLRPAERPFCRCRQWEPCWPSETDWATLNSSIDGNLISARPIGRVCHEPTYDQQACEVLLNVSRNSGWRAAQPGKNTVLLFRVGIRSLTVAIVGTLQDWVWESGSTREKTCYVGGPVDIPCHQGRTPLYSAAVRLVSHVQYAIKFAKDHNLRLAIQNTGHDGSGRSSAHLKHTHYHDDFQPVGAVTTSGPAITVGAGVTLGELYAEGARQGYTIVGGVCPTVGLVGGFLQGGGVSGKFSHTRGLAVDSVLEIQAVTADVSISLSDNPSL
jgi:hypothetical protein